MRDFYEMRDGERVGCGKGWSGKGIMGEEEVVGEGWVKGDGGDVVEEGEIDGDGW